MGLSRHYAEAQDSIGHFRSLSIFRIYYDGNSLGRLPLATRERLRDAIDREWGHDLIRGWDVWIDLTRSAGDILAASVFHVAPGEVILSDSTSVNMYKLAAAALDARPGCRAIVDDDNFPPTDTSWRASPPPAASSCGSSRPTSTRGSTRRTWPRPSTTTWRWCACPTSRTAPAPSPTWWRSPLPRTGWAPSHCGICATRRAPSGCRCASRVRTWRWGARTSTSTPARAAPAFLYVRRDLQEALRQPIWGWFGRRDQFAMAAGYDPAESIDRYLVGTPPVLGGYAVIEGARITAEAGIDALAADIVESDAHLSYPAELGRVT
jgi:kynureninase